MQYSKMNREELEDLKSELKKQYDDVKSQNLKLNMARGKPSPEQLELSMDMLNSSLSASDWNILWFYIIYHIEYITNTSYIKF